MGHRQPQILCSEGDTCGVAWTTFYLVWHDFACLKEGGGSNPAGFRLQSFILPEQLTLQVIDWP